MQHPESNKFFILIGKCYKIEICFTPWVPYSRNIIEMIAIQRRDNLMWAIPGGMVDPGEKATTTLKREFTEEALNSSKGG